MGFMHLKMLIYVACLILMLPICAFAQISFEKKEIFSGIYEAELGEVFPCSGNTAWDIGFCANTLKNSQSAPRILMPKLRSTDSPKGLVVLQHGLSDTPFFVRSVADHLQQKGFVVILPLTPGHGKKVANADMKDELLQQRWYEHTNKIMTFAESFELPLFVGGFSTGGTFATYYALQHTENIHGILLFSGALALPSAGEAMANMWGIKSIAKWFDGDYETMGVHPHKYSTVASFSALALMDVIKDVRELIRLSEEQGKRINMPVYAAHSLADAITPYKGIERLVASLDGEHVVFKIDESYDLCHADLPMSQIQLIGLRFDKTKVNQSERCAVPQHNPLHSQMMLMLDHFLSTHLP